MPGWLSWLERTAHRVIKQCSDLFLGYREIAGSNPAPGIKSQESHLIYYFLKKINFQIITILYLITKNNLIVKLLRI